MEPLLPDKFKGAVLELGAYLKGLEFTIQFQCVLEFILKDLLNDYITFLL